MNAIDKIGAAILIVLLLPAVVAEWEQRRLPDIVYAMLAAAGLILAGVTGGAAGIGIALLVGLGATGLLCAVVSVTRSVWAIRPMTGGNIKLLAAGSVWLGAGGALLLILAVMALMLLTALFLRARNGHAIRPGFSPLAALATIGIFLSQGITHVVA